jgi:hypothetical protein
MFGGNYLQGFRLFFPGCPVPADLPLFAFPIPDIIANSLQNRGKPPTNYFKFLQNPFFCNAQLTGNQTR